MSDQVESQGVVSNSQAEHVDQEPSGSPVALEQALSGDEAGAQHVSQRGSRGGRQGQQRGGRYGANKYNYNAGQAGPNQYNRYNGSGRNYNGYKAHRGGMNAAAAMNMQWPGYYNPQMYYMAPQMPAVGNAALESPPSTSPVSSASSTPTPTPVARKIEITTKTGEHLDLNALHHTHHAHQSSGSVQGAESEKPSAEAPAEVVPAVAADNAASEKPESEAKPATAPESAISEAERTRREFLEQIKLRKAALEKKKHEQIEAAKPKPAEPAPAPAPVEEEEKPAPEEPAEEVARDEPEAKEPVVAEEAPKKPVATFAEALKLKKEAAKQAEAEVEVKEPEQVQEQEQEQVPEPEVKKEEPSTEETAETEPVEEQEVAVEKQPEVEVPEPVKEEVAETEVAEPEVAETATETAPTEDAAVEETAAEGEEVEKEEKAEGEDAEEKTEEPENKLTVTQLLDRLKAAKPIEDIYAFTYPEGIEAPDARYKKSHIKYTYGPTFLLQFKDKVKVTADDEWVQKAASKIVIPPGMGKGSRPRDPSLFGGAGRMNSGRDFGKSGSYRNMDGRSNSRNSSKRKSKRMVDDRRSNRGYTSRRDRERERERGEDDRREDDKPKEDVAPLVPSANRWVPKSRQKKTEKKMAPDGVTELLEKEEAERKMKSLLNKLTLEMFDTISADILAIANQSKWEEQGETLNVVIEEVFIKACDEPHWSSMYAQLCGKLVKDLDPEIKDENNEGKTGPKLVLHYLVARCHAEFDKGWADKLPANEDGTPLEPEMMSDEYYKAAAAKRRGLGLVRFIGFLYRLNLLTGKMMFECFRRLMKDLSNAPSEETLESVVELLSTVGEQFESDSFSTGQMALEGSALLDSLFAILQNIIENAPISNRMKFKLVDIRELRELKHWNSNKKEDGPKTIQQIHEEEERQRQLKNNNSRNNSRRMNTSLGSRNSFKRDAPMVSKDNFISTRSTSQRHNQKPVQKEEPRQPQKSATNMFSALMDDHDDDE